MTNRDQFRPTLNALENRSLMSASPWAVAATTEHLASGLHRQILGRDSITGESAASGHVKVFSGKSGEIFYAQPDSEPAASGRVKVFDGAGDPPIRSFAPDTAYLKIVIKDSLISSAHGDPNAMAIQMEDVLISSVQSSAAGRG